MGDRLKGRVAVVTGSSQGIGEAVAIAMAEEGAKVVTNNRRPGSTALKSYKRDFLATLTTKEKEQAARVTKDAETTAKAIRDMGGEAVAFYGDVSDYEVARQLIKTAVDNFGKIDILVNNAGTYQMSPVWEMALEDWNKVVNSHLQGTYNCIRHAAGLMREQKWGRIINATSGASLGSLNHCSYSAAKGGIESLTRAVAMDMYPYGVTCNSYSPTTLTRALASVIVRSRRAAEASGMPSRQVEAMADTPGPETIAPFIVYLATEEAANITGTVFGLRGSHIGLHSEPAEIKAIDKEEGIWTVDELVKRVPRVLLKGYESRPARSAQARPAQ